MTVINIQASCRWLAGSNEQSVSECINRTHDALLVQYWGEITKGFSNPDGVITISDVGQMIISGILFPGNILLYAMASAVSVHDFFEMSVSSFNSGAAFLLSIVAVVMSIGLFGFYAFVFSEASKKPRR